MDLIACTNQADSAVLTRAILLYSPGAGGSNTFNFATVHPVAAKGKRPVIMPGTPLSCEALVDALGSLMEGTTQRRWQPIDTRVVASGHGLLAWWSPRRVRHLHFAEDGQPSGLAAQPAMFWVVNRRSLHVFCLGQDERPALGTPLMNSVHFNVYSSGSVCLGTSVVPPDLEPERYEQMFYESRFTHPHGQKWQLSCRSTVNSLWRRLVKEGGKKPFPAEVLRPAGKTVEQALDAICGKRGVE